MKSKIIAFPTASGLFAIYKLLANHLKKQGVELCAIDIINYIHEESTTISELANKYAVYIMKYHFEPYVLLGFSFAGVIAFETANILAKKYNKDVEMLIMVDTPIECPSVHGSVEFLIGLAKDLAKNLGLGPESIRDLGEHFSREECSNANEVAEVFKVFIESKLLNEQHNQPVDWLSVFKQCAHSFQMWKNYAPTVADIKMLLIKAGDNINDGRNLAWSDLTSAGLKEVVVPGEHAYLMTEPCVKHVANHIISYMLKKESFLD